MKKSVHAKTLLGVGFLLSSAATALAAGSPDSGSNIEDHDKLVIVVHKFDDARNAFYPDIGGSTYTFDREAIAELPQGSATPLRDVMTRASGAEIDSYGQLHVRLDHADIQYRINGVTLPSVGEGFGAFGDTLDTHFAQKIKLIDGAFPVEYGPRVTSIIDLTTMTGAEGDGGRFTLMGGSNSTLQANDQFWGTKGKWNYYFSGTYNQSDRGIEPPTRVNNALHDNTQQDSEFGYASYVISPERRLSVILGNTTNRFEIPNNPDKTTQYSKVGFTVPASADINEHQFENSRYGIVSLQGAYGDATDYQFSLISRAMSTLFKPDNVSDLYYNGVASRDYHNSVTNGIQADASYKLNKEHIIRYGMTASYEQSKINDISVVYPSAQCNGAGVCTGATKMITTNTDKDAQNAGAYVQDEWKATDKLTFNYGARYDYYHAYITADQVSPRAGATYALTTTTTLHGGYARYFTAPPTDQVSPTIVQQFNNTTGSLPTANSSDVKPETDNYYDFGITQKVTPHLTMGADAFYREAHNWLDETKVGNTLIRIPFNYRDGRVKGVDLTADYKDGAFNAYANLTIARALVKGITSGQFTFDQDTLNRVNGSWVRIDHDQLYSGSAGASYTYQAITYDADVIYGTGLRKGFASSGRMPYHAQVNTAVSHSFDLGVAGPLDAKFSIMNLFDKIYEIRDGTGVGVFAPQYGVRRTYFMTLSKPF